jgi:hypothetical protein
VFANYIIALEKAPAVVEAPPVLPFAQGQEAKADAGEEMDRFTVDEGVVKIVFPSDMTSDSVEELEQFLNLFIKKAKRRAKAGSTAAGSAASECPLKVA